MKKRTGALLLALVLLLGCAGCAADGGDPVLRAAGDAAEYLLALQEPAHGGEWLAVCLGSGVLDPPSGWLEDYLESMAEYAAGCDGVLSQRQSTEYSLAVLAVTAAGGDARDVGGWDLTLPLQDYELVTTQGMNGPAYALIALDSGGYPADIREQYIRYLLSRRLADGGFAFRGDTADTDMTAIVLQALAPYQEQEEVAQAVEEALARLASLQGEDGNWQSWGVVNAESCAQVILALCALDVSLDDPRFTKNGAGPLDVLLTYQLEDGSFSHLPGGESDVTSTRQALEALTAAALASEGQTGGLFRLLSNVCTLEIRCDVLTSRKGTFPENMQQLIPDDGVILPQTRVAITQGETVFDILQRTLREEGIHFEFSESAVGGGYVQGIANLYEYDGGELSGWQYSVNGIFPSLGCAGYTVSPGDAILWQYTCDLGADIGNVYDE